MQFTLRGYDLNNIMKDQGFGRKSREQLTHEVEKAQADLSALLRQFESQGLRPPPEILSVLSEAREIKDLIDHPQVNLSYLQQRVGVFVNLSRDLVKESQSSLQFMKIADTGLHIIESAHAASEAAHRTVSDLADDVFGKKKYDAYLRFSSTEDEEAYRARSDDRERYIRDQLALGTPEGNLNAARAMREQLKDAGAHGADAHPDFAGDTAKNDLAFQQLATAMQAVSPKRDEIERGAITSTETAAALPSDLDAVAAQLRAAGVVGAAPSAKGHGVPLQLADGGVARSV